MASQRDNELDMARDIASLKERMDDLDDRSKLMEGRWEKQDRRVLEWLTRALFVIGIGAMGGSMEGVRKKIVAIFPWLGQ
jgi:hypothetical protein